MHVQMTRLYSAALKFSNVESQSALARLLNVSPQTINNWEYRGISLEGLLLAQQVIGCNAIWLRDGSAIDVIEDAKEAVIASNKSLASLIPTTNQNAITIIQSDTRENVLKLA